MNTHHHKITVCTSCRHKGQDRRPGFELIERLKSALAADDVAQDFDVTGVACMAGCDRPCTVAYQGSDKATYLFGDIDPESDIDDLVTFAKLYADLADGWCSSLDRPGKLRTSTLARVPSQLGALATSQAKAS